MIRHSGAALTAVLALLLVWGPLPFGGVPPWAESSLRLLAFLALGLAAFALERPADLRPAALPAAALALIALLGFVQSLPWPATVVAAVAPSHAELRREAAALVGEGIEPEPYRLTLSASASRSAALGWAAAAAALLAGAAVSSGRQGRERRRVLLAALLGSAVFQVLYGAQGWFARSRTIWGVEVSSDPSRLRGTFVNPNHLALYLGLALPAALAWGWWAARRARQEPRPERRVALVAPPALLWLLLFAGLAFTRSRAGLAAAVIAAVGQGALLAAVHRRWRLAPVGAALAALGLAVVAALGFQEGLGRVLATSAFDVAWDARRRAYAATLELWRLFPWTGSGLGTFRDAFPLVQPADLPGTWWHAHSDPLELLATAGPLGAALALAGLAGLAFRLAVVLRRGKRSEDRAAGLAACGMLLAAGFHELLDFGLTMPGSALTLAAVAGAAAAARMRSGLEEAHGAGEHPAALRDVELEEVEPAAERGGHGEGRPPSRRRRKHREGPHGGSVEA